MDYLGAQSNSLAFCLVGREAARHRRCRSASKDIRVLIAELQRITSHLVWLGTHGMEIGAVSVMMYCFREREQLLNINEMLAGFRMFPSYIRDRRPARGPAARLPRGGHGVPRQVSRASSTNTKTLLTKNQIWLKRTQGRRRAVAQQDVHRLRAGRPDGARRRRALRRAQGVPVPRATRPTTSTCRRRPNGDVYDRYLVRDRGDAGEREICRSRRSSASRRAASTTSRTTASCRRRRTRSTPRWKR